MDLRADPRDQRPRRIAAHRTGNHPRVPRRAARGRLLSGVLLAVLLLLPGLLLSACGGDHAALPVPGGQEAFFPPEAAGAFAVGRRTFTIVDPSRGDRTLPVDAWYPVDPEDAGGEPSLYELLGLSLPSELAVHEAPLSNGGPFPLIVYSHGSGGVRFQSFFLTELLASHGFVVVAPDHVGNTLLDDIGGTWAPLGQMYVERPLDVSFLITRMLEKNTDPADPFHAGIDAERIGVTGHSFGGYTSFAQAAGLGQDPSPELAAMLPEGFEPIPPDPRVRSIAPAAPTSWAFTDAELAAIGVPTLILGGTLDTTTPIDPHCTRPFALIPRRVIRLDVDRAVHFSFTNSCDMIQVLVDAGIPLWLVEAVLGSSFTEPCGTDVLAVEEVHRITNLYTISHFHRFLNGDARYETYLTAAYAERSEPNVTHFSKGE